MALTTVPGLYFAKKSTAFFLTGRLTAMEFRKSLAFIKLNFTTLKLYLNLRGSLPNLNQSKTAPAGSTET